MNFYQPLVNTIIAELKTSAKNGLTGDESVARLNQYGYNRIKRTNKRNMLQVFLDQFKNMLVILLIVAAALSFFLNSNRDGIILMLVVFFNALIGFYQDWKSENILASLKDLVIERCFVFRNGKKIEVPSDELVPGDIVSLSEGNGIPADIRLIESTGFSTTGPLSIMDWLYVMSGAIIYLAVFEVIKLVTLKKAGHIKTVVKPV